MKEFLDLLIFLCNGREATEIFQIQGSLNLDLVIYDHIQNNFF